MKALDSIWEISVGDTPKPYGVAGWDSAKPGSKGYLIYQNCCAILVLCTSPRVVSRFSVLCGGWDTLEQNGIIWSIRVPPARYETEQMEQKGSV